MSTQTAAPSVYSPHLPLVDRVPPTPLPRLRGLILAGASVLTIFLGGFGGWSAFAPLQSAAVAPGVVAVETYRKTVQHLEGGGMNFIGDTVWIKGEVTRKWRGKTGIGYVECRIEGINQRGDVIMPGTAIVALPSRGAPALAFPIDHEADAQAQ